MIDDNLIRDKILNAAEKRMVKFGYRKVTMDEIAQDLGMSKNTIYKYFQSKMDIAESLFLRLKKKINDHQIAQEKESKDPLVVISQTVIFVQKELAPWFEHFLGDIKSEVPNLWIDFVNFRSEKIMDLKILVEKGIKKGTFRKVDASLAVRAYLGAIDSIINPEVLEQEKISFYQALEAILDIWSKGILVKK